MSTSEERAPDLQSLLEPVHADQPAGRDLNGTLELNALESASREPDEVAVEGIASTDERNWREIRDSARALLAQSKDLRVAVQLSRALLQLDGLPGFCAGIQLVGSLAERYWDSLFPALDPDDGDATMRIHAIQELVSVPFVSQLRTAAVASVPGLGTLTVNDVLSACGSPLARANLTHLAPQHVFGALDGLGVDAIQERLRTVREAIQQLNALTSRVRDETGQVLQLGPLTAARGERRGLLDALAEILSDQAERMAPPPTTIDAGTAPTFARAATGADISRREDVVFLLDRICAYYARVEPSSPVPLVLQRAKRLATMDFLSIIRDLANDGLPQVATVTGVSVEAPE